jgi:hypothetical protein
MGLGCLSAGWAASNRQDDTKRPQPKVYVATVQVQINNVLNCQSCRYLSILIIEGLYLV